MDGTITDSAPVILSSFCAAFEDLGIAVPDHATLMRFVGPPLADTFTRYAGLTGDANARAVATYRSHYRTRMHQAPTYEGMPELVRSLNDAGVPLAVATSKRESLAREIIEHSGLGRCFATVSGADENRCILRHFLESAAQSRIRLVVQSREGIIKDIKYLVL